MSENTKRMLTLLMAVSMLFSMMPLGVSAQAQTADEQTVTEQTMPETTEPSLQEMEPVTGVTPETTLQSQDGETALQLDVLQDVVISESWDTVRFSFTPAQTGMYMISSVAEYETLGYLYDSNSQHLQTGYGYSHLGNKFQIFQVMDAGATYYLDVRYWGDMTGTFQVWVERSPLESISFTPVSVVENTNGYISQDWNPETEMNDLAYWRYSDWQMLRKSTYTATFTDGTVLTGNGSGFYYDDVWYDFSYYADQSYSNQWTAGNTYNMTVSIMGLTVQVPVTITKSPLESISFTPVSVMEGTTGGISTQWNPETEMNDLEYWQYNEWQMLQKSTYTATFTDGTVLTGNDSGFYYNGVRYEFSYDTDQSYSNQWTAGNTYNMTVSVMGQTVQVPITITASPLQSITYTPITIIEGSCGYITTGWDSETQTEVQYFYYNPWDVMGKSNYTATFSDGTVQGGSGNNSLNYNGEWYSASLQTDQDYSNQWTVGNTYYINVSVMGQTVEVPVTIVPSPVVSFTVEPVTMIEGKDGSYNSYWPGDGSEHKYYSYYWWHELNYTVTLTDGTVINGQGGGGFWYQDEWYSINTSDSQGYESQWTAGNTYEAIASIMGATASVSVTIKETPVAGVVFEPVILEEHTGGYWSRDWDTGIEYYKYDIGYSDVIYTITFKDGTVKQGTGYGDVEYDGERYSIETISYDQNSQNPWLVGNTYTAQVRFAGKEYDLYVSIHRRTEDNGYTYFVQDGKAIINGCTMQTEILQIPETIDGYPVVGIISLGEGLKYALEIRVPDCVTMLSGSFLRRDTWESYTLPLKKLVLGSGIVSLKPEMIQCAHNLECIEISANNPYLCSVDGVVYDKAVTTLILYPIGKQEEHRIPDTVTDIDTLFDNSSIYEGKYQVIPGAGLSEYKVVDGIIYNADMTEIIKATTAATGSYVMPDTVTEITPYAFQGSNLTSITIASNVTGIAYCAFAGAVNLEEIVIPNTVKYIEAGSFAECTNLKKVQISDLIAWCEIWFFDNPLWYAHDLYLNGELVKDLVLPETVSEQVYTNNKINFEAFTGGSFETVTIPSRIVDIGHNAFLGCENLEKVYITDLGAWCGTMFGNPEANPLYYARDLYLNGEKIVDLVLPKTVSNSVYVVDSVYGAGDYTFCNINIESLTVPEYVYSIGQMAFCGSTVETVVFEEGCLDSIGMSAFESTGITSLDLPDSLQTISPCAFRYCEDLETVTFGSGLKAITYEAFLGSGIKSVSLPNSLTYLGGSVFASCLNLRYVNFGETLNVIPYQCFYESGIKKVTLPEQIEFVESGAFANSALEEVIFNCENVTVWDNAFLNCPLGDLELGGNVKVDGWNVFSGINATQIKLEESVTAISYREFAFNKNLVSVTIPESVEYIYDNAFEGDDNLSHVLYAGNQEQWNALEVGSEELLQATLHCDANGDEVTTSQTCTTVTYYCAICDKEETVRKGKMTHTFNEDDICTICGFQGHWEYTVDEESKTVTITKYVGRDADVVVPDTIEDLPVTAITSDVFAFNHKITSVVLPDGITEIPAGAFKRCTDLRTVTLGEGVTAIGEEAFFECYALQNAYLPDAVTTIGDYAFCYSNLYEFKLPKKVTTIGEMAFAGCNFESIELPDGITEIAYCAFSGCWSLEQISIPDTVTSIGYYAFMDTAIKELAIPESVKQIGHYALMSRFMDTLAFLGDRPEMGYAFNSSGISIFYTSTNKTWDSLPEDDNSWYACAVPTITKQPVNYTVEPGQTVTLSAEAHGQRLSYQWYYAAPGAKKFTPVGGDSIELTMIVDESTSRGRAYCLVTDIMGQTAKTKTVTLRNPSSPTGIRLTQLPYTLEYDMRQELRTRGLEVVLTYNDNSEEAVFDYTVTGYDPNVGGKQTITVSFGGYTATFTVTVNEEKLSFVNTEEKIEISAPEGAVESSVELVVEKLVQEEETPVLPELPVLPEIIQENEAVIFDISLEKGGEPIQPTDTVQVSIPVPEHMERKRCKVYHIADDGTATDMNAWYKDGRMVFDTNHFSYYAVVETSGVTISGTVTGNGDITGTEVKLLSGGEVLETVSVSKNGTYLFENVVANDYVIEAIQEGLPAKQTEMTIVDQDVTLDILLAILGDVDGDDTVTRNDAIRVLLYALNPARFPLDAEADFDGDTTITRNDAIRLLLYVLNPNRFPLGE